MEARAADIALPDVGADSEGEEMEGPKALRDHARAQEATIKELRRELATAERNCHDKQRELLRFVGVEDRVIEMIGRQEPHQWVREFGHLIKIGGNEQ